MRLIAAPVVPEDVTTFDTSSDGMLRSSWLLNSPMGSIGACAGEVIRSESCSILERIRWYGSQRSLCSRVSACSRPARISCLSAWRSEYWSSSTRSSTCIALAQPLVVDLPRRCPRERFDLPHGEGPWIEPELASDCPPQIVGLDAGVGLLPEH